MEQFTRDRNFISDFTLSMKKSCLLIIAVFLQVISVKAQPFFEQEQRKAQTLYNQNQLDDALYHYDQVIRLYKGPDKDSLTCEIYLAKAEIFAVKQDYARQYQSVKKAISSAQKVKSDNLLAKSKIQLAEYFRGRGFFDRSIETLKQVERILKRGTCSKETQVKFHGRYAAVLNESTQDFDEAMRQSEIAINIAQELGDSNLIATSLNEIGFSLEQKANFSTASIKYREAAEMWISISETRTATQALGNLARSQVRDKEYEKSIQTSYQGLDLIDTNGWYSNLINLYAPLINSLEKLGRYKEALEIQRQYNEAAIAFKKSDWNTAIAQIEAELQLAEKNEEIATEKRKKQESQNRLIQEQTQTTYLIIGLFALLLFLTVVFVYARKYRESSRKLEKALTSKELLLKEVHHRVKNNLQVISSLLNQQAIRANDDVVRDMVDQGQRRIKSMAMIHQKLYETEDFSEINIAMYTKELTNGIGSSLSRNDQEIQVHYDLDDIRFNIDISISLGLILNELITNAYKYAFYGREKGTITISLKPTIKEHIYLLTVRDNGIGLPDDFDSKSSKTLGMNLVKGLSWQLRGEFKYFSDEGSTFAVTFNSNAA